jgi:phosphoribosylpyrophosphate synthetase
MILDYCVLQLMLWCRMDAENIAVSFIPYSSARQDRVMIKGEPLSVKVYADITMEMQFDKVSVLMHIQKPLIFYQ